MRITNILRGRAQKIKSDSAALYLAFKRKNTPRSRKNHNSGHHLLCVSPIDLIPDFIPVLGFLDDVLLLPPLIVVAVKPIPNDILNECREQAKHLWKNGKPKKFWYSIPIIAIWIFLIALIVKAIFF